MGENIHSYCDIKGRDNDTWYPDSNERNFSNEKKCKQPCKIEEA